MGGRLAGIQDACDDPGAGLGVTVGVGVETAGALRAFFPSGVFGVDVDATGVDGIVVLAGGC